MKHLISQWLMVVCVALLPVMAVAQPQRHLVRPGETLYGIARQYGVSVEAIQAANPAIEGTNIPSGMMLTIPEPALVEVGTPVVPATTQPASPEPQGDRSLSPVNQVPVLDDDAEAHWTDGVLTLAVILPFNLEAHTPDQTQKQMRSVEFYEGVLLAVDEVQQRGRRVEVLAYDLGTQPMSQILDDAALLRADMIVAPIDEQDVEAVAAYGEAHHVPVISPFVFSQRMQHYTQLLQVNTPKAQLYPQLTRELMKRFSNYTFVFLTDSLGHVKADPYALQLRRELPEAGVECMDFSFLSPDRLMACDSLLGLKDAPVMFVPVTPSKENMRRIFSGLQHVKILRDNRAGNASAVVPSGSAVSSGNSDNSHTANTPQTSAPQLAILGYPEWALMTDDFIDYFYDLNVYMFSKVYVNPFDSRVKQFYSRFKRWYGKDLLPLIPKYGMLGYDVAHFAFDGLSHHGRHLMERIDGEVATTLQTMMCFDRPEPGVAYCNQGLFLIHFTPESSIEKLQIVP